LPLFSSLLTEDHRSSLTQGPERFESGSPAVFPSDFFIALPPPISTVISRCRAGHTHYTYPFLPLIFSFSPSFDPTVLRQAWVNHLPQILPRERVTHFPEMARSLPSLIQRVIFPDRPSRFAPA